MNTTDALITNVMYEKTADLSQPSKTPLDVNRLKESPIKISSNVILLSMSGVISNSIS